jgi:hypothetical protein
VRWGVAHHKKHCNCKGQNSNFVAEKLQLRASNNSKEDTSSSRTQCGSCPTFTASL